MLEHVQYCPILHTRVAEVKALLQLAGPTKDRMFPVLVWRPWPNAKALARTGQKIEEALEGRRFAVDLDGTKLHSATTEAGVEFDSLFDPADGHRAYYNFVGALPGAVPVLRPTEIQLDAQLAHIDALDRGVVVRISYGSSIDLQTAARTGAFAPVF